MFHAFLEKIGNCKIKRLHMGNFSESYNKARIAAKMQKLNTATRCNCSSEEHDKFKARFGVWMEWSGSRFVSQDNPNPAPHVDLHSTCISVPVTGCWRAL